MWYQFPVRHNSTDNRRGESFDKGTSSIEGNATEWAQMLPDEVSHDRFIGLLAGALSASQP